MTVRKTKAKKTLDAHEKLANVLAQKAKTATDTPKSPPLKTSESISPQADSFDPPLGRGRLKESLFKMPPMSAFDVTPSEPLPIKVRVATDPVSDDFYAEIFISSQKIPERILANVYLDGSGFNVDIEQDSPVGRKGYPSSDDLEKSVGYAKQKLDQYRGH